MTVNALRPRADQLTVELESLEKRIQELETSLRADEAELDRRTQERAAQLEGLTEERSADQSDLERNRERALVTLQREWDVRVAQAEREIGAAQKLFEELAGHFGQAVLARAELDVEDVRLVAEATAPFEPVPRYLVLRGLIATVLGGLLGILAALVRESSGKRRGAA
jgi:uncharacterized protein involved in exopolysaccharide biosynthesis